LSHTTKNDEGELIQLETGDGAINAKPSNLQTLDCFPVPLPLNYPLLNETGGKFLYYKGQPVAQVAWLETLTQLPTK
jgi:hypothetical protein